MLQDLLFVLVVVVLYQLKLGNKTSSAIPHCSSSTVSFVLVVFIDYHCLGMLLNILCCYSNCSRRGGEEEESK